MTSTLKTLALGALVTFAAASFLLLSPCFVSVASADERRDYRFGENGISRKVLENYLDRSVTMAFYRVPEKPEGRPVYPFHGDDARFLRNIGTKFVGRAIYRWRGESRLNSEEFRSTARSLISALHAEDPEVIFQGCLFEIITTDVDKVKIPAWVLQNFGLLAEERHFSYEAMLNDDGKLVELFPRRDYS